MVTFSSGCIKLFHFSFYSKQKKKFGMSSTKSLVKNDVKWENFQPIPLQFIKY